MRMRGSGNQTRLSPAGPVPCEFMYNNNIIIRESTRFTLEIMSHAQLAGNDTNAKIADGSILGPLLFLIYINDLPDKLSLSKVLLFAYDAKCFLPISSRADCLSLQHPC